MQLFTFWVWRRRWLCLWEALDCKDLHSSLWCSTQWHHRTSRLWRTCCPENIDSPIEKRAHSFFSLLFSAPSHSFSIYFLLLSQSSILVNCRLLRVWLIWFCWTFLLIHLYQSFVLRPQKHTSLVNYSIRSQTSWRPVYLKTNHYHIKFVPRSVVVRLNSWSLFGLLLLCVTIAVGFLLFLLFSHLCFVVFIAHRWELSLQHR